MGQTEIRPTIYSWPHEGRQWSGEVAPESSMESQHVIFIEGSSGPASGEVEITEPIQQFGWEGGAAWEVGNFGPRSTEEQWQGTYESSYDQEWIGPEDCDLQRCARNGFMGGWITKRKNFIAA